MNYISTRDPSLKKTSAQVIKQGLADDGGLFMPEIIPHITFSELKTIVSLSYPERAAKILSMFLTDYDTEFLNYAAHRAYSYERFGANAVVAWTDFSV